MNGPYHPRSTLCELDLKIKHAEDKLKRIHAKQTIPGWQEKRNEQQRKRQAKKKAEDPEYKEKINAYAREDYRKNKKRHIAATVKWQKANKAKKNATNTRYHAKNKDRINAARRLKRKLAREAKHG